MPVPDYIGKDAADRDQINAMFGLLSLPEPDTEDFFKTRDGGALLCLKGYGTTIRVTETDCRVRFSSPNFLRPIFQRESKCYTVPIMPGVESPLSEEDRDAFVSMLDKDQGITIHPLDRKCHNFGMIPGTRFPVMLDVDNCWVGRKAFTRLVGACQEVRPLLPEWRDKRRAGYSRFDNTNPQDRIYNPLRRIMEAAWPEELDIPKHETVKEFWTLCRDMVAQGKLVEGWKNNHNPRLVKAAQNYAQKLAVAPPHL